MTLDTHTHVPPEAYFEEQAALRLLVPRAKVLAALADALGTAAAGDTVIIPRAPNAALLRPFISCPEAELPEAWEAMLRIAATMAGRAALPAPPAPPAALGAPGEVVTQEAPAAPIQHQGMTIAGNGAAELGKLMREQWETRGGVYPDGNPNAGMRADLLAPPPALAAPAAVAGPARDARAAWFALTMGAAASLDDAANCLRDKDAQKVAMGAATHVRDTCNKLWWAAPQAPAPNLADAYMGAREDVSIWKRRALEAERDLRAEREANARLVAEVNAANGPTHIGEAAPQAPAAPSAWLGPVRELLGHLSDVLDDEAFGKIDTTRWNAVSSLIGTAPASPWKDHQTARLVNDLRDCAIKYHPAGQLRERIAHIVAPLCDQLKAAQSAPAAPSGLPSGWVSCILTHDGQHPEEVAYGPQIMMDRLKMWLGRYFEMLAAPAAPAVEAPVYTYTNQPTDNVTAWRLGEACAAAAPGGDPIDRGLSLLQQLQGKGFGIVFIPAQAKEGGAS